MIASGLRQLGSFLALRPGERWRLVRAGLVVVLVRLALWLVPVHRLSRLLAGLARRGDRVPADDAVIDRVSWAVHTTARRVPAATCLTRALATQFLLEREGYRTELRIGFARTGQGPLEGHAWLACGERVVVGNGDLGRFASPFALEGGEHAPVSSTTPTEGRTRS